MEKVNIETIEEMVPYVQEHLLPEIQQAVEVCVKSFWDDPVFNDMYTFGTQFWKNTWNRLSTVSELEDCPFDLCGKGNEYKLKMGPFVLRHHRINEQSKLPSGGKAVKSSADYIHQMSLFNEEWYAPVEVDNIVLAI